MHKIMVWSFYHYLFEFHNMSIVCVFIEKIFCCCGYTYFRSFCLYFILTYLWWPKLYLCEFKGDSNPNDKYVYQKELSDPWILAQVSSKSVEKWGSYGHLKNSIWPIISCHFEYLISFQYFFNCLIFSYQYYHIICVSADMQPYT